MTGWLSLKARWRSLPVALALAAISAPTLACPTSNCQIGGDPKGPTTYPQDSQNPVSTQRTCRVVIEFPNHMEFGVQGATCDQNGMLTGHQNITIKSDLAVQNGVVFTFDSYFKAGHLSGQTSIQTNTSLAFTGQIFEDGTAVGRTVTFDGGVIEGQTRDGVRNLTGTLTRSGRAVEYFISGEPVSKERYAELRAQRPKQPNLVAEMLKRVIVGNFVDCLRGGCQTEMAAARAADQRRQDQARLGEQYRAQQAQVAEGQRQVALARQQQAYIDARIVRESAEVRQRGLDVIEDARRKQLAGLDRDGNPIQPPAPQPIVVAGRDPIVVQPTPRAPTPTVSTNPPAPEFGGDTKPPAPEFRVATSPPAIQAVETRPPELPVPIIGTNPPAPEQPTQPALPEPVTATESRSDPGLPAPVQNSGGNPLPSATIGAGQQQTIGGLQGPVPGSQPAASPSGVQPNTNLAVPTQPQPVTYQGPSVPRVPTGLYPINSGELAQPIPLGWSAVPGATSYRIAVKDQSTGSFPVNDLSITTNGYTVQNLPAGRSFTWDVAACNQAGCSGRSPNGSFRTGGVSGSQVAGQAGSSSFGRDVMDGATQGTKDCVYALVRETGESVESAYQLVTSAGGWQQIAGSVANSAWNIVRHPILSAQAVWNGLTGQVSGVRDAVNAGNPSLACQRAVTLSSSVIGAAEGAQAARATLSNLRRIAKDSGEIAANVAKATTMASRGIWDDAYGASRGDIIHQRLGQNTPGNFPAIDIWDKFTGRAVSIKSMDTLAATYQSANAFRGTINGYVDQIANFADTTHKGLTIRTDQIRSRELLLAVPPEGLTPIQIEALVAIRERARLKGVSIILTKIS